MYKGNRKWVLRSIQAVIGLVLIFSIGSAEAYRVGKLGGYNYSAVDPPRFNYGGYDFAEVNDIYYKNPDWMGGIPDERRLSELSIPGTHETMAIHGFWLSRSWETECQQMFLDNQLRSGIRALDIRLERDGDNLKLYHGQSDQHADFEDVLYEVVKFLEEYPTEIVIMHTMENDCDLPTDCPTSTRDFVDLINSYLTERYYDGVPYESWIWQPTSRNPMLGELRGEDCDF